MMTPYISSFQQDVRLFKTVCKFPYLMSLFTLAHLFCFTYLFFDEILFCLYIGQAYVMFHQIYKIGQRGHVTRIVSGCNTKEEKQRQKLNFKSHIQYGIPTGQHRFHLHITPDYTSSNDDTYTFFNKPYGLLHWLQNEMNMPSSIIETTMYKNAMFIILDPDQILLRPFTSKDFSNTNKNWYSPQPVVTKWKNLNRQEKDQISNPYYLRDGNPISQVYSMGTEWINYINQNISLVLDTAHAATLNDIAFGNHHAEFIKSSSFINIWTEDDVDQYYNAGPPYILTGYDMYRIVKIWASIVKTIYEISNKEFLSEMYAYSTAAAYLSLPHNLGRNFMISNYDAGTEYEGWESVDALKPHQVCKHTISSNLEPRNVQYRDRLPFMLHYCQEYFHGPTYYFFKHYVSDQLLSCEHPLLVDPNDFNSNNPVSTNSTKQGRDRHLVSSYKQHEFQTYDGWLVQLADIDQQRQVFMLCHLIARINEALTHYKDQHCISSDNTNTGNYSKSYIPYY
jgi:peptidyl serine alpha-galactosyltransferase